MRPILFLAVALQFANLASAGEPAKKVIVPPEEDHWKFVLAVPGWMAGVNGTVGINGINSNLDVGFKDVVNKIDMVAALRGEVSKGRFGVMGELFYISASDSLGVGGPLRKIDARVDEYLCDFTLRWRLLEGERGFVDALAGVRYTNLYQHVHLQSDPEGVAIASENTVNRVGELIRDRLLEALSDHEFRNALIAAIKDRLGVQLDSALGGNPRRQNVPIGPLDGREGLRTALLVEDVVRKEEARLSAEVSALKLQGPALVAEVQRRIDDARKKLEDRISAVLEKNLNRSFERDDDWWDPYVGVRARYNFTPAIYVIARADIGGFGVGSDLMWQAEGALGFQLSRHVFAEVGYRALSFDYHQNGLLFDVITHGAQVTMGVEF